MGISDELLCPCMGIFDEQGGSPGSESTRPLWNESSIFVQSKQEQAESFDWNGTTGSCPLLLMCEGGRR